MDLTTFLLGGLIGAIIGMPFALFINLATPAIKAFLDRSSLSFRSRYINSIKSEYFMIKSYKQDYSFLMVRILKELTDTVAFFSFFIILFILFAVQVKQWNTTEGTLLFFAAVIYSSLATAHWGMIRELYKKVTHFDKYKKKTIAKLKKLGGNPEDLDKDETEQTHGG